MVDLETALIEDSILLVAELGGAASSTIAGGGKLADLLALRRRHR